MNNNGNAGNHPAALSGAAIDAPPCGNQQCGQREALLRAANLQYQQDIITLNNNVATQAATHAAQVVTFQGQINQLNTQVGELTDRVRRLTQPVGKHHEIVRWGSSASSLNNGLTLCFL